MIKEMIELLYVCKNHVLKALKALHTPHVIETEFLVPCHYCNRFADYEMYYDDIDYTKKSRRHFKLLL
jgi:hypothetical protein